MAVLDGRGARPLPDAGSLSTVPPAPHLGTYTHPLGTTIATAIDGSVTGVRVHAPGSPGLTGFLNALTPGELAPFALVALTRGKRALAPLPAILPHRREGWLLDATAEAVRVWNQATKRAVEIEPGFFHAAMELSARLALLPWEGMAVAPVGAERDGRAPAWVDGLRIAHIELITKLRHLGLPRMEHTTAGVPVVPGAYGSDRLQAELTDRGVRVKGAASSVFEARIPLELPTLTAAVLFCESAALPALPAALGGRSRLELEVDGEEVVLRGEANARLPREALLALLELDLRWAISPFEAQTVARAKRPDTGCPPWVGKGRYLQAMAAGQLLGDGLQPIESE